MTTLLYGRPPAVFDPPGDAVPGEDAGLGPGVQPGHEAGRAGGDGFVKAVNGIGLHHHAAAVVGLGAFADLDAEGFQLLLEARAALVLGGHDVEAAAGLEGAQGEGEGMAALQHPGRGVDHDGVSRAFGHGLQRRRAGDQGRGLERIAGRIEHRRGAAIEEGRHGAVPRPFLLQVEST